MTTIQEKRVNEHRDRSRDGLSNRFEAYFLSNFDPFWALVSAFPSLKRWANRRIISRAASRASSRPHRVSSMAVKGDSERDIAGYTSWESLTDRDWFTRHLPPRDLPHYPDLDKLKALFQVGADGPVLSEDSTVLFLSFAQWFTDGFLMTRVGDTRQTDTSHHIDFNPLYGLTREQTSAIRVMSEATGEKGLLKFETDRNGEVFAPKYFDDQGHVKDEFAALRSPLRLDEFLSKLDAEKAREIKKGIFAFAGERANTTPFTSMLNTLFLREHNRLAKILEATNPSWDDERVFQTARNINIVLLIKIVMEEYINHISPYHFQLIADPSVCWHASWNKTNWIPIEFNLLYRWHSLTPDAFEIADEPVPLAGVLYANAHLEKTGLGKLMERVSQQPVWNMGVMNTTEGLVEVELASVQQGRTNRLASYNDYREALGFPRVTRFEQITGDDTRVAMLRDLYQQVDNIEFFVGLFAEDVPPRAAVPPLIGRMVALDAFSQALTNPLLSKQVFNDQTFTPEGMAVIESTRKLQDVLNRNIPDGQPPHEITMTRRT